MFLTLPVFVLDALAHVTKFIKFVKNLLNFKKGINLPHAVRKNNCKMSIAQTNFIPQREYIDIPAQLMKWPFSSFCKWPLT